MAFSFLKWLRGGDKSPQVVIITDSSDGSEHPALAVYDMGGGGGGGGGGDASAAKQDQQTVLLTSIEDEVDGIETLLAAIDGHVDGLETQMGTLLTQTDALETNTNTSRNAGAADATTERTVTATDSPEVVAIGAKTDTPATVADATPFSLISVAKGILKALGFTNGAAVITDADGTIQQYLRGIIKLIVSILPVSQNAATIPTLTTLQNVISANANGTTLNVQGYAEAIIQIVSSPAMSGGTIVNFEISEDDAVWESISSIKSSVLVTTTSTDGYYKFRISGFKSFRARISNYSAGTVTVKGWVTPLSSAPITVGLNAGSQAIGSVSQGTGAAAGSSWRAQGDYTDVTGLTAGSLNADILPSTDVSGFQSIGIHILTSGSATFSFQGSMDNSTFVSVTATRMGDGTTVIAGTTTGLYTINPVYKYLRIRLTSYTSGTFTASVQERTLPTFQPFGASATSPLTVQGGRGNNTAVPGTVMNGVVPAVANAAQPTVTEGNLVVLSTDLGQNLRVAPTPYPAGATPIAATSGNVAAGSAAATLAGVASKTTYITGFEITASGATVGSVVVVTVTNIIGGLTLSYIFTAPAGILLGATPLTVEFPYPIPASATNTAIVVTCPSLGAGNTNAVAIAHGFQL